MTVTINGSSGITAPEVILDNTTADGGQVVLKSSGYSNWNLDNYSGRFRAYYGSTEYFGIDTSGRIIVQGASSTYGAATIVGSKNGWSGLNFRSSAGANVGTVMVADGYGGFFNSADNEWLGYFNTSGMVLGSSTLIKPSGYAPMYPSRAWVNFNGQGTVSIRASGNVSSITDNGTGYYTVNFTTAMPDASYAVSGFASFAASAAPAGLVTAGNEYSPSSGAVTIKVGNSTTGTTFDSAYVNVTIHR